MWRYLDKVVKANINNTCTSLTLQKTSFQKTWQRRYEICNSEFFVHLFALNWKYLAALCCIFRIIVTTRWKIACLRCQISSCQPKDQGKKETQGGKNHVSLGAGAEKETESASAEILVSKFVVVLTTSWSNVNKKGPRKKGWSELTKY